MATGLVWSALVEGDGTEWLIRENFLSVSGFPPFIASFLVSMPGEAYRSSLIGNVNVCLSAKE